MDRLKELREEKSLNQQGLAMKLNVSQSTVSYYETGERKPDLDALIQLADFFDVSMDYLTGRSNIKKPSLDDERNAQDTNFYHDYVKMSKRQKEQIAAFMQGLIVGETQ